MRTPGLLLMSLVVCAAANPSRGSADTLASLDEVVVSGDRPGPGMWRVSRDSHVLWILGTPELLPRRVTWQSAAVESVLDHATLLLLPPSVDVKAGPITWFRLYRQWRRSQELADHATLREALDRETYARFSVLKQRYLARDRRIEQLRPMLAADRLFDAAIERAGLSDRRRVIDRQVLTLAKRSRVPVRRPVLAVQEPRSILDELNAISRDKEVGCLETTIRRLETDLHGMVKRANAWALGDMSTLRRLDYPDNRAACTDAIGQSPRLSALLAQFDAEWLASVEDTLATHDTALALAPIWKLLDPDGVLKRLRERGFTVEEPAGH